MRRDTESPRHRVALMHDHDFLTQEIIGCAIEVHRVLGPGLSEAAYEEALCLELRDHGLTYRRQVGVPVTYKGTIVGEHRPDLVVSNRVVVELKSCERIAQVHGAQLLMYMRILGLPTGLLINFNNAVLKAGVRRFAL